MVCSRSVVGPDIPFLVSDQGLDMSARAESQRRPIGRCSALRSLSDLRIISLMIRAICTSLCNRPQPTRAPIKHLKSKAISSTPAAARMHLAARPQLLVCGAVGVAERSEFCSRKAFQPEAYWTTVQTNCRLEESSSRGTQRELLLH